MASQILGPSRPTPAPTSNTGTDGLASEGLDRDLTGAGPGQEHDVLGIPGPAPDRLAPLSSQDDMGPDEPAEGSSYDEIGLGLARSMSELGPDPNLQGPPKSSLFVSEAARATHTSEIFRSVVGDEVASKAVDLRANIEALPEARPHDWSGPDVMLDASAASPGAGLRERGDTEARAAMGPAADPPFPWGQLLLLSYSSALTLAVTWMLWAGRLSRQGPNLPVISAPALVERPASSPAHKIVPAPPVPRKNTAELGAAIQLGELSVVPLVVEAARVVLVHSLQSDVSRSEDHCLVLRLKITNTSSDHTFAPLDKLLVREHGMRAHDPYIAVEGGGGLELFPLAVESEWEIEQQNFGPLAPGETREFFIAAEPGSAHRVADHMLWRARLRTSVYQTDMLAVPFTKQQVHVLEYAEGPAPDAEPRSDAVPE